MTSPVPDAFRTQLAEVLAEWMARPSQPDDSQRGMADDASYDLWPYVEAALARARAEGAAEALREAANVLITDSDEAIEVALGGVSYAARFLRRRAAALSAPTTTEGDPT